jgi:hypothetical protein
MDARVFTCKRCGGDFTVRGSIKHARDIHEARYCPAFWEQDDDAALTHPLDS